MHDEILAQLAHERIESMLREAASYRALIDASSLRFGEPLSLRLRSALSRTLRELAARVEPCTDCP